MTPVVGVDGGGTRIRAVAADPSGRELGRAEVEGAVVGVDSAALIVERVGAAVRTATREAGVSLPVKGLWAGLAGAGREEARREVVQGLEASGLAEHFVVGTDVEAAFHDAFGSGPGILLIAGTGSIAWARNAAGSVSRVGGWGERLGDEGSGYAIGVAALRAVAQATDGRAPATSLTSMVLDRLELDAPDRLIPWTAAASKRAVAALVPLVAEASMDGDAVASAILSGAVADLAAHVDAVIAGAGPWSEAPGLVLWGGILQDGGPLHQPLRDALASRPVTLMTRAIDPAMGAVRLALAG